MGVQGSLDEEKRTLSPNRRSTKKLRFKVTRTPDPLSAVERIIESQSHIYQASKKKSHLGGKQSETEV